MWLENKQNPHFFDKSYRNGACVFIIFAAIIVMLIKATSVSYDNYFFEKIESSGSTLYLICVVAILLSYAAMMLEAYFSHTLKQIRSMKRIDEVKSIIDKGMDLNPKISFALKNYHYLKDDEGKELKLKPR